MSLKISFTPDFERQVKLLNKKHASIPQDLESLVQTLYQNPTTGINLGHGIYKIRLAISSKVKGKSSGARVITYFIRPDNQLYLLLIYDKSTKANISKQIILKILKKLALI